MGVAIRVSDYLKSMGIEYQVVPHTHSQSAVQSAVSAGVSAKQTAKSVMLEDHEGRRIMAVVPAANRLIIKKLNQQLGRDFHLIPESHFKDTFDDCEIGALPAVGDPYQVQAVYDDQLGEAAEVYLEAGDHQNLIKIDKTDFHSLVANHQHGRFSIDRNVDFSQTNRAWDWQ